MEQGTFDFFTDEIKPKEAVIAIMPKDKSFVFKKLLLGAYILKRGSHDNRYDYCLYKGKNVPIRLIKNAEWNKLKYLLRKKNDQLILNLKEVRRLHGRNHYKRIYREIRQQQKVLSNQNIQNET